MPFQMTLECLVAQKVPALGMAQPTTTSWPRSEACWCAGLHPDPALRPRVLLVKRINGANLAKPCAFLLHKLRAGQRYANQSSMIHVAPPLNSCSLPARCWERFGITSI